MLDTPVLPGSVAQVFALAAAAELGLVSPATSHLCRRVATADGRRFVCTHPDLKRPLTPAEALAYSCNDFFVQLAARLPRAALNDVRRRAGLEPIADAAPWTSAVLGLAGPLTSPPWPADGRGARGRRGPGCGGARCRRPRARWCAPACAAPPITGSASPRGPRARRRAGEDRHVARCPAAARWAWWSPSRRRRAHPRGARGGAGRGGHRRRGGGRRPALRGTSGDTAPGCLARGEGAGAVRRPPPSRRRAVARPPAILAIRCRRSATGRSGGQQGRTVRVGVHRRQRRGARSTRLPLEEYVARVISGEGQPRAGAAAHEALAIVIRTFAARQPASASRRRLRPVRQHALPGDASGAEAAREAALATAGRVLLDRGQPAFVYYSAHCGGIPALASEVWPGAIDYRPGEPHDDACDDEPGVDDRARAGTDRNARCAPPACAARPAGPARRRAHDLATGRPAARRRLRAVRRCRPTSSAWRWAARSAGSW